MEQIVRNETELAILELKKATEDLLNELPNLGNDLFLLSWLKARDMDVMQAEKLIRQYFKWCRTEREEILSTPVPTEVLDTFTKTAPKSFCRDGRMIEFMTGAQPELPKILTKYGLNPILRIIVEETEAATARVLVWSQNRLDESKSKEIIPEAYPGFVKVFNAKNITLKQATSLKALQFLRTLAHINSNYCPFMMSKIIIINCPRFVVYIIKKFKPLVETKFTKFEVYDGDETLWKEALLKYVHPDSLPISYGGNMKLTERSLYRFQDMPFP